MLVLRLQDAAMSPAELEMHCCDADTVRISDNMIVVNYSMSSSTP